jgi:hypothetical protein
MPASIPRAALAALACLALAASSAHGASIFACIEDKCASAGRTPIEENVKTDGACAVSAKGYGYKCTAASCTLFSPGPSGPCGVTVGELPANKVTAVGQGFFLYEDLTGAIVGGIIGGLAFLALIATWRFHATKTGPFAEGQTWVGFLTCKAARSGVIVGGK